MGFSCVLTKKCQTKWWINTSVFILHESNVNIVDAYILHVDGEVGHDGEGGPVEEEEGALQGEQVHVRPEAATLRGTGGAVENIEEEEDEDNMENLQSWADKIMKALFYPSGRFTMLWKRRKRDNKREGIKYFD